MYCKSKTRTIFPPETWVKRSAELRAIENYDGQGKTQQEEEAGSVAALGIALSLFVVLFSALAIYILVSL